MPRKGPAPKRPLIVDPVYGSPMVTQLINKVLTRGSGRKANLEIKVFGGGLINSALTDVGAKNIEFVRQFLAGPRALKLRKPLDRGRTQDLRKPELIGQDQEPSNQQSHMQQ